MTIAVIGGLAFGRNAVVAFPLRVVGYIQEIVPAGDWGCEKTKEYVCDRREEDRRRCNGLRYETH